MVIIQSNKPIYLSKLKALYLESFGKGNSVQYIDEMELDLYLTDILDNGFVYLALDNETICGALLSYPMEADKLLPESIKKLYPIDQSIYIAEMMVAESARGVGIGTQLLDYFFETIDKNIYTDAFIRVWEKNIGALKLYIKTGFMEISTVAQTKQNHDKQSFIMNKIYLHKKIE